MATITIQFDPANSSDVEHAFKAIASHLSEDSPLITDVTINAAAANENVNAEEQGDPIKAQEEADAELAAEKAEADKKAEAAAKRKEAAAKKKADEEAAAAAEAAAQAEEADDGIDGEEEEQSSAISREEVRKALKEYSALEGKSAAIQILKDHGASSMSELKEEHFEAVLKIVNS